MYLGVLAFLSLLLLTVYVSYAVFSVKEEKSGTLNIVTGTLYSHMESSELDSHNKITVSAGETKSFNVTLKNINNRSVKMNFYYQWISSDPGNVEIGYSTTSQDVPPTNIGYVLGVNDSKVITVGIKNNSVSTIILQFKSEVGLEKPNLEFPENSYAITNIIHLEYKDTSGANKPELVDGLIPVIYNEKLGEWIKSSSTNGWYAYQDQVWANAVTTTEANRSTYMKATPGTVIPMSDINTMWVWIPRYEYKFSNMATGYAGGTALEPGAIGINFIAEDVTTPSDAANYKVHPAFTFGTDQLAGIWVGKFETAQNSPCSFMNFNCNTLTDPIYIKPNFTSWRGAQISLQFTSARNMVNANNTYGFNSATADSHMMKNTEWGAVAYLSQSKYGKSGNSNYNGVNREIYINNYWNSSTMSQQTLTGCSGGSVDAPSSKTCSYTYEKDGLGTGASTTGTIYGIYDMSGGAYEHVMGNMKVNGNSKQMSGNTSYVSNGSGFNGINYSGNDTEDSYDYPDGKYYDSYNYDDSAVIFNNRYIVGDATYEISKGNNQTSGWYSDNTNFVNTGFPWFRRGGQSTQGVNSGIFSFEAVKGGIDNSTSFRVVLVNIYK